MLRRKSLTRHLFVAQALHGVELRCADGEDGAEESSYERGDQDRDDRGEAGNGDAVFSEIADGEGNCQSDYDADYTANRRNQNGFRKELEANFAVGCSDGFADSDLANASAYRGEHDIHDADAADQQNYQRNREQNYGHGGCSFVGDGHEL